MKVGIHRLGTDGRRDGEEPGEKGFSVTTMAHRNREPLERLVALGASEAADPQAVARQHRMWCFCA